MLIQIAQMIFMLSILVVLHEWGHYITAKWFGTRVEKFYLFFNPYFSVFKKKIGETEYGIGWLPLGGYVKISGMIDESFDKEQLKKEPQPYEFRSKKPWQKLIIMLGGIIVNILLAWVIYTALFAFYGQSYQSVSAINNTHGFAFGEVGEAIGFKNGDKILSVDGKKQEQFRRQVLDVLLGENVSIERDGKIQTIQIKDEDKALIFRKEGRGFISPRFENIKIDSVINGSAAAKAGLKKGDKIVEIEGVKLQYVDQINHQILAYKNDTINMKLLRNNSIIQTRAFISDSAILGVNNFVDINKTVTTKKLGLFAAIPVAIEESFQTLWYNIKNIKLIFKPKTEAYKQARSIIGITRVLPKTWDWQFVWSFTAMFSMWLAFINLVPIPGLDGGHALITIGEMITGRTLNQKTMEVVQSIGVIILIALMVLLFGKDIYDVIQDNF